MAIAFGSPAPDFSLLDQSAAKHSLKAERGKWVILYFYPKDDTPGCTTEACEFRDLFQDFKNKGVTIFGVSKDSAKSHQTFASNFALPFPLLSDPDAAVIQAYGAWGEKKFLGKTYMGILRTTYVIDPKGKIAKVYEKVKPEDHPAEILRDIAALQSAQ